MRWYHHGARFVSRAYCPGSFDTLKTYGRGPLFLAHIAYYSTQKRLLLCVCVCVYKTTFVRVINALGFENLYYHRHYIILYATRVARRPYVIWYLTAVAACWDNNIHSVWPNEVSSSSSPPPCPCRSNRITRIIILIINRVRRSVCAYTTLMINGCCRICVRVHSERGSRCRDFFCIIFKVRSLYHRRPCDRIRKVYPCYDL